jgi:predicted membrane protein
VRVLTMSVNPFDNFFRFVRGFLIVWVVFAIIIVVVVVLIIYFVIKAIISSSDRKKEIKSPDQPYPYKIHDTKKMKYCEYCGQQITPDAVYCPHCNAEVK